MPTYKATVRYGAPRFRYHVEEIDAASLVDALRRTADALPPEVAGTAELAEIRRQPEPEERTYAPG